MPTPLPFVLSIPHAGLETPPELMGRVALDETDLFNECDLWADLTFDFGDSPGVLATVATNYARAIIDVNRAPDSLDDPDGVVKTQTSYGTRVYSNPPALAERQSLRDRYWGDYHARLEKTLAVQRDRVRLLLDCHNMAQTGPSHYAHAGLARPFVCLANLGGPDGEALSGQPVTCPGWVLRRAGALAAELFADMTLLEPGEVSPQLAALNFPFAGGYIIRRHCRLTNPDNPNGAPLAIMVEINRGLFAGNQNQRSPVSPPNLPRLAAIRNRLTQWAASLADLLSEVQD